MELLREGNLLKDQLDVERQRYDEERARFDQLLDHLIGNNALPSSDEEPSEFENVNAKNGNWLRQKQRLAAKSVKEFENWRKNAEVSGEQA